MVLLRLLSHLWLAPVGVPIWVLFVLPSWVMGWHGLLNFEKGAAVFAVVGGPRWYRKRWQSFSGLALPWAVFLKPDSMDPWFVKRHEFEHTRQWRRFGPLFPVLYLALLVVFGYRRHPFEVGANRVARGD